MNELLAAKILIGFLAVGAITLFILVMASLQRLGNLRKEYLYMIKKLKEFHVLTPDSTVDFVNYDGCTLELLGKRGNAIDAATTRARCKVEQDFLDNPDAAPEKED